MARQHQESSPNDSLLFEYLEKMKIGKSQWQGAEDKREAKQKQEQRNPQGSHEKEKSKDKNNERDSKGTNTKTANRVNIDSKAVTGI